MVQISVVSMFAAALDQQLSPDQHASVIHPPRW